MKDYYVVLHGAKKNVGDFLIRDRAKKLLQHVRPDRGLVEYPSWHPLDEHLETLNKARALIIMGGPGISQNTYPGTFPLVSDITRIKVPIVLMGTGSYINPISFIDRYRISDQSLSFLKRVEFIGTRDTVTRNLLLKHGLKDAVMTGCPAWYDVPKLNAPLQLPDTVRTIVMSTPAKKTYFPQFVQLAEAVLSKYRDAEIVVTFNRGYQLDRYTNKREAAYMSHYYLLLKERFKVVDLSYDLDTFLSHLQHDLHIGYRLHTHIAFISHRKPSYLLAEDSRSFGHYDTLCIPGWKANKENAVELAMPYLGEGLAKKILFNLLPIVTPDKEMVEKVLGRIDYDLSTNFSSFLGLDRKLDCSFDTMRHFLLRLP